MNISVIYPASSYFEFPPNDDIHSLSRFFSIDNLPPIPRTKYKEFMELVTHRKNPILIAWRGGRIDNADTHKSSIELIQLLTDEDYNAIRNNNVQIVGLSDISFLHCSLLSHQIESYYGPNINSSFLDSNATERKIMFSYLSQALQGDSFSISFVSPELNPHSNVPWVFSEGKEYGRVSGGNLDTICEIIKRFGPTQTGILPGDILFLEENHPIYSLSNGSITQSQMYNNLMLLKTSGILSDISGLILGRSNIPRVFDLENDLLYEPITNEVERKYLALVLRELDIGKIPIIANVPCGHTKPTVTLPLGRRALMDTMSMTLTYDALASPNAKL